MEDFPFKWYTTKEGSELKGETISNIMLEVFFFVPIFFSIVT